MSATSTNSNLLTLNSDKAKRLLFITGALLTILGSFAPWYCAGDFIWYCVDGVRFDASSIRPNTITVTIMALGITSLIIATNDSVKKWRVEAITAICVVGLLFLLATSHALEEYGGLTISILSGLALWQAFRFNQFSRKPNILFAVNTLAIAAISSCYTVIIWFRQISEQNVIGGTSLQSGLLAVFLGSLIMLALLIWSHLSNHQSEIHQQSP